MLPAIPTIPNNAIVTALNAVPAPNIPTISSIFNSTASIRSVVPGIDQNNNNLPMISPLIPQQTQLRVIRNGVSQQSITQPLIPDYSESTMKTVGNAGKRWSKEEEAQVMSWATSGINLSEIGNRLGRSTRAIKMRVILLLSTRFQNEGVFNGQRPTDGTPEEICQRHHVMYNEVLEYNSTNPGSRTSRFPANNNNNNNTVTSSGLGIPNPGTLPVLPPLTLGPQIGLPAMPTSMQGSMQGSTLVNNNILTEIRDLLVQLNNKLDRFSNITNTNNVSQ